MKSLYQERAMHELCEITSSKRIFAADYQTEGVPFFRGKEITERFNGAIGVSTELFISRQKFEEIKAKFGVPKVGDLLLTSVGTLGSTYVVQPGDEFYFKDGNITWFRNFKGLNSTYLHYWLSSPAGKAEQKKCTIGSSQSAYTIVLLKEMKIALPPLEEQERIASILSAYDDLIENNTRRIAIVEEMARRIYEEWFVRFRFPGHEQVKMVESELGLIPEGWSVAGLFNLATVKYGKNLPTKHLVDDGPYPVYGAAKVIGRYSSYTRENRTIIAGCRGSVGQFQITEPKCFVTNNSFMFDPVQPEDFFWLYFSLRNRGLKDIVGGAAQPQITLEGVESVKLVAPQPLLRQQFRNVIESIMHLSWNLAHKNANLRSTRDLLLPKLISGELDVSTLPEPEEAIAA